ncbi:MAG: inositol monophosphatase [Runella slithyformis]|nr:MAG: inositol monophosphatase [Runella slithyformis]TAF22920.1 MAG: inositol monophosphatase [Runella slithyformis]TAF49179.1 MAG: inositol monophosphatase [Runella slithyformis]
MNLEKITQQIIEIVRQAGVFIQTEAARFSRQSIEYKAVNDLVSYVDKEAERLLVSGLRQILPQAGFITEEDTTGQTPDFEALNWIVDPLDGTANFIHGLPVYCVSVGLARGKEPLVGVILHLGTNELFYGWQGGGAWLSPLTPDGGTQNQVKRLQVSVAQQLSESLLATGFPYYQFDQQAQYLHILQILMQRTHGLRRMGAAAIDLAYVAAGRFEGFYEYNLHSWDMAAGVLLVKEAGGHVSDFAGGDTYLFGGNIIAACGVHAELLDVIQTIWNKK